MIKNVIFDLGKVLIDTNPSKYLRKYGYDEEKYQALLDAILYDSLWSDMDIGKYDSCKEIVEIYVAETGYPIEIKSGYNFGNFKKK